MKGPVRVPDCYYTDERLPDQSLDLYLPRGLGRFPLLVFFHGGGLEAGDKADIAGLAEEFCESGIAVASPNYRMFPRVGYPVFIEDAARAVAWIKNHIDRYGRMTSLFVGGHSAGAYLSMMLCLDPSYLGAHGIDADSLNGYIFGSGQPTTHFNVLKYRGRDPRQVIIDEAAPIYHIRPTGAPLQIFCADGDIENRLEQTRLMVSTLRHFDYGSEADFQFLEGHDHGSYTRRQGGQPSPLFTLASAFIARHS